MTKRFSHYTSLFVLFMGISLYSCGQTTKKYQALLWRVSGHGLSKPSYIYGTMHVADKKLFYFSDSLYKALENCEGFVNEVDMNNISELFGKLIDAELDVKGENNLFEPSFLLQYRKKLEREFGKPAEEITIRDLAKRSKSPSAAESKKGDMETFMDTYLFSIARHQGKWLGGLEEMDDQLNLLETKKDKAERLALDVLSLNSDNGKVIKWLKAQYVAENLDDIDLANNLWEGSSKAKFLYYRNIKMASHMDSISQIRSCLYAIGAAHLPGDSGVIYMLRNKGYTVEPVVCAHKIAPEDYIYTKKEIPWVTDTSSNGIYTIAMPTKAMYTKKLNNLPIELHISMDIATMKGYLTMAIENPTFTEAKSDSILRAFADRMNQKKSKNNIKVISQNEVNGLEMTFDDKNGKYWARMFVVHGTLAMNVYFSQKKITETDYSDAYKFFNSFQVYETPIKTRSQKAADGSYLYDDEDYEIRFPTEYTKGKKELTESGTYSQGFQALDLVKDAFFGLTVINASETYHFDNDSTYIKNITSAMGENLQTSFTPTDSLLFQGKWFYIYSSKSEKNGEKLNAKVFIASRGNKRYMLFTLTNAKNDMEKEVNQFIRSFKVKEPRYNKSQLLASGEHHFSLLAPQSLNLSEYDTADIRINKRYTTYDSLNANTYFIDILQPVAYYSAPNDSVLFRDYLNGYVRADETEELFEVKKEGNKSVCYISYKLPDCESYGHIKAILNGDTVYTLFTYTNNEQQHGKTYKSVFESFKTEIDYGKTSLLTNRTEQLFKALRDGDSTEYSRAVTGFNYVNFTTSDLSKLHEELLYNFRDSLASYTINQEIGARLILLNDPSTLNFIENKWKETHNYSQNIYINFLHILAKLKTPASYTILKQALLSDNHLRQDLSGLGGDLRDTTNISLSLFPELFQKLNDTNYCALTLNLACYYIDSGLLKADQMQGHKGKIYALCDYYLADNYDEGAIPYDLIHALGLLSEPQAFQYLHKLTMKSYYFTAYYALKELIDRGQAIYSEELFHVASFSQNRSALYHTLLDINRVDLFPIAYRHQMDLAESELSQVVLTQDDLLYDSVLYIKKITHILNGIKCNFYLYRLYWNDSENPSTSNLVVVGPYAMDEKNLLTDNAATGIYWEETYNAKEVKKQFEAYLSTLGLEQMEPPLAPQK
jgi:uncharacterized protein YbaP (TraB family)